MMILLISQINVVQLFTKQLIQGRITVSLRERLLSKVVGFKILLFNLCQCFYPVSFLI